MSDPRLYVDADGIWREDTPGVRFGIPWDEIYSLSGHKIDGITETYTCVVLDFEYGEYIELFADWLGFQTVIAELSNRLVGLGDDWYTRIESLATNEPPLVVWTRGG